MRKSLPVLEEDINKLLESDLSGKEKMVKILSILGIGMIVGGCGCCGSPWVNFSYKGRDIFEGEGVSIDTTGTT